MAEENSTVHNDLMEEATPGAASSSAPASSRKRSAEVVSEDLEAMADIMSLHVGPAYQMDSQGSICEVYSPPRVVPHAERSGICPGWSLDLTTTNAEGCPWDFSKASCRAEARKLVQEHRPLLLIGSPMCTWFSALQNLKKWRQDTAEWQAGYRRAVEHMRFVFELYELQVQGGRYFLHEHPAQASSWKLPEVVEFCARYPHLYAVTGAMCQFGLVTPGPRGDLQPARKLTRWLTNSACLAETLERPCLDGHTHTPLLHGRAAAAQVYPPQLCKALSLIHI